MGTAKRTKTKRLTGRLGTNKGVFIVLDPFGTSCAAKDLVKSYTWVWVGRRLGDASTSRYREWVDRNVRVYLDRASALRDAGWRVKAELLKVEALREYHTMRAKGMGS